MRGKLLLLLATACIGNANAALVWSTETYSVDSFKTGDSIGGAYYVTSVTVKEAPPGCAGVSSNGGYKTFTCWSTSAHSISSQLLISQFAYAHAQQLKVRIQYDNANCDAGMGWYMRGVQLTSETAT